MWHGYLVINGYLVYHGYHIINSYGGYPRTIRLNTGMFAGWGPSPSSITRIPFAITGLVEPYPPIDRVVKYSMTFEGDGEDTVCANGQLYYPFDTLDDDCRLPTYASALKYTLARLPRALRPRLGDVASNRLRKCTSALQPLDSHRKWLLITEWNHIPP
ncbi:hypothetical protein CPC08DRAFT_728173 [Agrocybe pediades]|nr:hypothetical protein CPC08DRAFT_728173 [Agrocybe pediades]